MTKNFKDFITVSEAKDNTEALLSNSVEYILDQFDYKVKGGDTPVIDIMWNKTKVLTVTIKNGKMLLAGDLSRTTTGKMIATEIGKAYKQKIG